MVHFSLARRLVRLAIYGFGIVFIISLVQSIVMFWQRGEVVTEEEKRLVQLEKRNKELDSQFEKTQQSSFIERQARDKLNMSREGEYVVVLPPITPVTIPTSTPKLEPWQEWWQLLRLP